MDNEKLTAILTGIVKDYGYVDVSAKFESFRDIKMTWTRSYKMIYMPITDYLKNAPESIIEGILSTVISRIMGDNPVTDYPQDVIDYFTSPEFSKTHVRTYLKRARIPQDQIVKTVDGYTFVVELTNHSDMPTYTISPLMRVIGINPDYIGDSDIEHIGIMAINNKIAEFGHFKGVKA